MSYGHYARSGRYVQMQGLDILDIVVLSVLGIIWVVYVAITSLFLFVSDPQHEAEIKSFCLGAVITIALGVITAILVGALCW